MRGVWPILREAQVRAFLERVCAHQRIGRFHAARAAPLRPRASFADDRAIPPRSARACGQRCEDWHRSAPTCAGTRCAASCCPEHRRGVGGDAQGAGEPAVVCRRVRVRRSLRAGFQARVRRRPCGNRVRPARPVRLRVRLPCRSPCRASSASVCSVSARSKSPSAINVKP